MIYIYIYIYTLVWRQREQCLFTVVLHCIVIGMKYIHWSGGSENSVLGLSITRTASANQNAINIPREKPEEWLPCLAPKLKLDNRAKDSGFRNTPFRMLVMVHVHC